MRVVTGRGRRRLRRGAGLFGRRDADAGDRPLAPARNSDPGGIRICGPPAFDFGDRLFARHEVRIVERIEAT
jgi:hypothetical protein